MKSTSLPVRALLGLVALSGWASAQTLSAELFGPFISELTCFGSAPTMSSSGVAKAPRP